MNTIQVLVSIIAIIAIHIAESKQNPNEQKQTQQQHSLGTGSRKFSGLYKPETVLASEDYAGSWLAPVERFLQVRNYFPRMVNVEHGSLAITATGNKANIMTRDFFDLMVLHLSSTTNLIPGGMLLEKELINRMKSTVEILRIGSIGAYSNLESIQNSDIRRSNQTVAIIVFSLKGANSEYSKDFNNEIRSLFFQATFWSIYRQFPHVLVSTPSDEEVAFVHGLKLPLWRVINVMPIALFPKKDPWGLPRITMKYLLKNIDAARANESIVDQDAENVWRQCKYLYYSEGDSILHTRNMGMLFSAMDKHNGQISLIPHRMQTIALPKSFPQALQKKWPANQVKSLEDTILLTEDAINPMGSCCDNGRFHFPDCGNWWYNCPNWGLQNYTRWIRFGDNGFTMPLGTEHKARCTYYPQRRQCPMPNDCPKRFPKSYQEFCLEMPSPSPPARNK